MRIAYHLGAHCTDDERLLRTLIANRALLADGGVVVPDPGRYRNLIRDTATQLRGQPASRDTQALVLDQIMDEAIAARLVLSWDSFLAFPQWVLRGGQLYPAGGERVRAITQIFPEIQAEFFLAIRNPASFLPDLYRRLRTKDPDSFLEGTSPLSLRWSDLIGAIMAHSPGVPLTVWCDEDTPLIWPEVLAAICGTGPEIQLQGVDGILSDIMLPEGMERMLAYMEAHPPTSVAQRRRVVSAFLDKFARPEKLNWSFEMPGWDAELVAQMTAQYEGDCAYIATLPGVTFLTP